MLRIEQSTSGEKLSRLTPCWKKMKQVEFKKYKIQYRGASRLKALFGNSGP